MVPALLPGPAFATCASAPRGAGAGRAKAGLGVCSARAHPGLQAHCTLLVPGGTEHAALAPQPPLAMLHRPVHVTPAPGSVSEAAWGEAGGDMSGCHAMLPSNSHLDASPQRHHPIERPLPWLADTLHGAGARQDGACNIGAAAAVGNVAERGTRHPNARFGVGKAAVHQTF